MSRRSCSVSSSEVRGEKSAGYHLRSDPHGVDAAYLEECSPRRCCCDCNDVLERGN